MTTKKPSLKTTTALSIISALIVVLTIMANFVRFGPFPITLALCPIIVGAALYGPSAGALLGFVFGLMTFITGILGWDGGGVMMMLNASPVALVIVCFGKAVAAGYVSGLVYKKLGIIGASVACPVVNTGIFIIGMLLWFKPLLAQWSGGSNLLSYIFLSLTGINFVVELVVNLALASGAERIIKYARKNNQ